jgi:hypothetical protein
MVTFLSMCTGSVAAMNLFSISNLSSVEYAKLLASHYGMHLKERTPNMMYWSRYTCFGMLILIRLFCLAKCSHEIQVPVDSSSTFNKFLHTLGLLVEHLRSSGSDASVHLPQNIQTRSPKWD